MRRGQLTAGLASLLLLLVGCSPANDVSPPVHAETRTPTPTQTPTPEPATSWSEEFDGAAGAALSTESWVLMDRAGGFGNDELQSYTTRPENVSLDGNGALQLTARAEDYVDPRGNRVSFTSGRVETIPSFLYGHIEARIKAPSGTGLWSAFWTIGKEDLTIQWPHVGEIDIMEIIDEGTVLHADVHANTIDDTEWSAQGQRPSHTPYSSDWHVYSVDWTKDLLVFAVDGETYHSVERSEIEDFQVWAFDRPQHIILNVAVGGSWPQQPTDPSVFPARMLVDYVRVTGTTVNAPAP